MMRMMIIVYDEVFDQEVMEAIERLGRLAFTRWERVQGRGVKAEPRMGSSVWPGYNSAVMVVADDEPCQSLVADLERMKRSGEVVGLSVFGLPVEALL